MRRRLAPALALFVAALLPAHALAQAEGRPSTAPEGALDAPAPTERSDISPTVRRLLDSEFIDEESARRLRLFHGLWTTEDLQSPGAMATVALRRGLLDHPALQDELTPTLVRAEAKVLRGELPEALALLDGDGSVRAAALRAEALFLAGRLQEAEAETARLLRDTPRRALTDDAGAIAAFARAMTLRLNFFGPGSAEAGVASDFQALMRLLARGRDEVDRLDWTVRLAEAELLFSKRQFSEAADALNEVIRLNPGLARAWYLAGRMRVEGFDFAGATQIAARLDALASEVPGAARRTSVYADLLLARTMLRQGDWRAGLEALRPTLARYPKMREALAVEAALVASSFAFADAEALLSAFDARSPGSPMALYEAGRELAFGRQYEEAADLLERANALLPTWADPVLELGLLEMQSGRDDRARLWLRRAVRMDPFNRRAENSFRVIEELASYNTLESDHFIVRYKPGIDALLAREMIEEAERIHERVAGDGPGGIDHTPPRKTTVELMPDHEWFSVRITGMPAIHTMAAATGPVIAMESPRGGARQSVGFYDWARVLQHEYAHTVTLSRTRNRIPHWFTEAAAVHLEDRPMPPEWIGLLASAYREGRLFDLDKINLGFIRPERPADRSLAYAQGAWMYRFIIDAWGDRAPLELMDQYAKGRSEREAVREVLGVEVHEFMKLFMIRAREDLQSWGVLPQEGQPDAGELLGSFVKESYGGGPDPLRLRILLAEHPDHTGLLRAVAVSRSDGNRLDDQARELWERLATLMPHDPEPRRRLVRHARASGEDEVAIEHLEWLDEREQHSPAYAAELARRYAELEQFGDALAKANRAATIAPFDASTREFAATIALRAGEHRHAERHLVALGEIEPGREIHKRRLEAVRRLIEESSSAPQTERDSG